MKAVLETLLDYAINQELITSYDRIYARNRVLSLLKEESWEPTNDRISYHYVSDLLSPLCDYAVKKGIIEDTLRNRDAFDSEIMNCFVKRPSDLIETFYDKCKQDPQKATSYFYHMSVADNYIRKDRIDKNISYKAKTEYGTMDITINLSKPEKDPRDIAKAKSVVSTSYPQCVLCKECEGYHGNASCDGRSNHRVIPVTLDNDTWYLQYSPYVYYNEHCIVLSKSHTPMKTCRETFIRLLDFVKQFPHYFIGSNADLPIVGGSILSHDHFQGGNYNFAMADAKTYQTFDFENGVKASRLYWPLSVLRLSSSSTDELIDLAAHILQVWRDYSDPSVGVLAHTQNHPHNTITSIARCRNGQYELDLVFRNNRTDEEHPLGIFHPHEEVHHIKKENIGLIEVMGLAVLPARLKQEMKDMRDYLLYGKYTESIESHKKWLDTIQSKYDWKEDTVMINLQQEIATVFVEGLRHCGIFSFDEIGNEAFLKLIETVKGTFK